MRWLVLPLLLLVGCAAKVGPGPDGWAKWDLCGWDGGVSTELNIGIGSWRLGCDMAPAEPEPEIADPLLLPECE